MLIAAATVVTHLDYSKWATQLLLDACGELPTESLERDLKVSHRGVLDTLRHIFYADRIWLARLEGQSRPFQDEGENPSLAELAKAWPSLLDRFKDTVAALGDDGVADSFTFRDLAGKEWTMPRWQTLLHVVNHGTLHRGQVMAMLRQLGHKAPQTDLIRYYREVTPS